MLWTSSPTSGTKYAIAVCVHLVYFFRIGDPRSYPELIQSIIIIALRCLNLTLICVEILSIYAVDLPHDWYPPGRSGTVCNGTIEYCQEPSISCTEIVTSRDQIFQILAKLRAICIRLKVKSNHRRVLCQQDCLQKCFCFDTRQAICSYLN